MKGIAIALLVGLALAGVQTYRLQAEQTAHAKTRLWHAQQETQRERAAREDGAEVRRLQNRHASRQQDLLHAYYQRQLSLARLAAADRSDDQRVRQSATTYAAHRGRETEGDSASCRAAKTDVGSLTALLVEGSELAGEGARLLRARDSELDLWYGIADNDRALTGTTTTNEED